MVVKILISFFFLLPISLFSQTHQIQGYLKDNNGNPVVAVTVTLKNNENKLVSFKNRDEKGYFEFRLTESTVVNQFFIEINYLGFKKIRIVANATTTNNILMEAQNINLAEIEIKSTAKVRSRGDTIKYDVAAFKKPEDWTIGEVISRMPGMEVDAKGQIKYNGKSISNLYINGDNLLDDKYSIGTKAIPTNMVKTIEVMQNHQPTRALQNKVLSDNIALNLVIADDAKIKAINQLKTGLGLPKQYDGELTNIAFNDKFKSLNVLKANNTGIDLASDFTSFNFSENLSQLDITRLNPILELGNVDLPPLPKQRYYFNKSGSLNLNNLINLKDTLQLKANVNTMIDRNDLLYQSQTDTYLPEGTIRYTEYQETTNKDLISEATFTLEANRAKSFIKNDFRLIYRQYNGNANLVTNDRIINQGLKNQIREFSNSLDFIPSLKSGNILAVNWHISHFNRPQELNIMPGLNSEVLNNNVPFSKVTQLVEVPTWVNRVSLSYNFAKYIVKHTYQIGVLNEFQKLSSDLLLTQLNGKVTNFQNSKDNELLWRRHQFFIASKFEYKKNRWETSLYMPATLQMIAYEDPTFNLARNLNRILLNPNLKAKYYLSAEDFLTFNYNYQNQIGNIKGIYPGVILTNYRNLNANQANLQQNNVHFASLQFNSQKSTKMLFFNGGINYKKTSANTINSTIVSENITKIITLPIENNVESVGANLGISKYISLLGSTANLNVFLNKNQSEQIFNGQRLPFNFSSFSTTSNIEALLLKKLRIKYIANLVWVKSSSSALNGQLTDGINDIQIVTYENAARISWLLHKNVNLFLNLQHTYTVQPIAKNLKYLFADATVTYRLPKIKTDFEVNLINLTNVKTFETYTASNNSFWQSNFRLRERMLLIKALFKF